MRAELGAPLAGLYALTPDWADTRRLLAVTEALLAAGCRLLQYRNKTASDGHRQEQAVALRGLTHRYGARLIVNDDIELARQCEADGVHLGGEDGDLAAARASLSANLILGASCYQDVALATAAARAGADYVAFGSFFASTTKPQAKRAEPSLLTEARHLTGLPVCAIGGITPEQAPALIQAGADLLAVISALYDAPDPAAACQHFIRLFEENRP